MIADRSVAARWRAVALLSAVVGAMAAVYLLIEYVTGKSGLCLTGAGCDLVRASPYAYPFGVPMPLFGVVLYGMAIWLVWRSLAGTPIWGVAPASALLLVAGVGVALSAVLTGLEAFVIRAWCSWCLVSAVASVGLFGGALLLSRSASTTIDRPLTPTSSRARRAVSREAADERASLRRLTTWASTVAVLGVSVLLLTGGLVGTPSSSTDPNALVPAYAPREGSGPVTVVEFADFQCPACASVAPMLKQLVDEGRITLVYRHFPLPQHLNAVGAARAALAAGRQGAFWSMASALYANQASWAGLDTAGATTYWTGLAGQLGLDLSAWQAALADPTLEDPLRSDQADAGTLNLNATPWLFINGVHYNGDLSLEVLRAAVSQGG